MGELLPIIFCLLISAALSANPKLQELLTIKQVTAKYFGNRVSTHSVRRWIAKGVGRPAVRLRAQRLGRDYFMTAADVEEFIGATNDPELYRRRQADERTKRAKRRLQRAGA